jgi:hypothetical protein
MQANRLLKIKLGVFTSICMLLFASLSTFTQAAQVTRTPTLTSTAPVQRAPCEGEPTRTPTSTPTLTPTHDPRNPTLTPTPTSQNAPFFIPLHYPPNCAVLHSSALPTFAFRLPGSPYISSVTIFNPATGFHFQIFDHRNMDEVSLTLPDGTYYWFVDASRASGYGGSSEIWEFRIDTRCNCTDTPTPTSTP